MMIYDPTKPTRLWDGRAKVFSTCRACKEIMEVISPYAHVHPTCDAAYTRSEVLEQQWITALCCDEKTKAGKLKKEIDALADEAPELTKAATDYASWGWLVFPLLAGCGIGRCKRCTPNNPCGKQPAISKKKGGNGFHDATDDMLRINRWWTRHPDHNIGLATGEMFDVIDIDPRNGGVKSFMELLDTQRLPPIHGVAATASGGMHLYIEPKQLYQGTSKTKPKLLDGIDYKAKGGYVVGPPSTLGARGRDYSWLCVPSPVLKSDF